ncbi:MAG: SUMF1/EgtB/PvdO family nonheme iron enzyme [Flavobacteriales bacterium]
MAIKYYLIVVFITLSATLPAQQVLDGVYVKEYVPTRTVLHKSEVLISPYPTDTHKTILSYLSALKKQQVLHESGLTYINYVSQKAIENVDFNRWTLIETLLNVQIENAWIYNSNHQVQDKVFYPVEFLKYYVDTNTLKTNALLCDVLCNAIPLADKICNPFYFKNTEVTNAEYREFYYWVRDSIAREILALNASDPEDWLIKTYDSAGQTRDQSGWFIDWKTPIRWNDEYIKPLLAELYYPENQRYYARREIDKRKIIYRYTENGIDKALAIYPDTTRWPSGNFNNPTVFLYFWHPAYDHFPVVNISYNQAKAFLHWKTKIYNLKLGRKKIKYRVEFDLPDAIEWYVAGMSCKKDFPQIFQETANEHATQSWNADVLVNRPTVIWYDTVTKRNSKDVLGIMHGRGPHEDMVNALLTSNLVATHSGKQPVPNKIIAMSNNVSEWLGNDLTSFVRLCSYKNQLIERIEVKTGMYLSDYKTALPKIPADSLKMVKGGNWLVEESNSTGIYKKAYVHQNTQSPFIGFRYVVHIVEEK